LAGTSIRRIFLYSLVFVPAFFSFKNIFLYRPGHDDKLSAASRRAGLITGGSTAQAGTT